MDRSLPRLPPTLYSETLWLAQAPNPLAEGTVAGEAHAELPDVHVPHGAGANDLRAKVILGRGAWPRPPGHVPETGRER